jgi:signal transduction histidine kinase
MLEMIETLLDFTASRFTGSLPIAPVATDLHDVCRGVVRELRAAAPDRSIELALEGDGRGTWDPARLAQVVSNLVSNALQHGARHSPVRVYVAGDDTAALLAVENEGPAIAPELMRVLFEPFCRGPSVPGASRARGLGLGLYIARQLVHAHGGTIDVESTPERGTAFTVRLPRASAGRYAGAHGATWGEGAVAGA